VRPSPITIGVVALAMVVLGTGVYLVTRPHPHTEPTAADDSPASPAQEPPPTPPPPPRHPPRPPIAAAPPGATPAAAPAPPPTESDPPPPAESDPPPPAAQALPDPAAVAAALKQRALLSASHNQQLVVSADEQTFERLHLPETTRAAVRQINEEYRRKTESQLGADPSGLSADQQIGANIAGNSDADRARRAAIDTLLGPDGAREFSAAEYAAERRLRLQLRRQWSEELDTKAPRPPGLPPSPH
jgi:hypothetical protein